MASRNDCTADLAERLWIELTNDAMREDPLHDNYARMALRSVNSVALVALAHQAERIGDKLESIEEILCRLADLPFTTRVKE